MGPDAVVELTTRANPRARVEPGVRELAPATKLVVNSAYGYLAAGGELTRFADVHEANEVTRHGRETLQPGAAGVGTSADAARSSACATSAKSGSRRSHDVSGAAGRAVHGSLVSPRGVE